MRQTSTQALTPRILLVDDDQLIANALAHVLRSTGYHADVAGDGLQALQKVVSAEYDLIVCDVRMPAMDGEAFYRALCTSRPGLAGRVVFCTGDMDNPNTRQFVLTSGAPYIEKPFRMRAVLQMLSGMLSAEPLAIQAVPSM
jgi:CheY-like chemotaxis protein